MKCFLVLLVVVASSEGLDFLGFQKLYGKVYSPKELLAKQKTFQENSLKVEEHNKLFAAGKVSFQLKLNQFADLNSTEFSRLRKGLRMGPSDSPRAVYQGSLGALPASVDWRTAGAVTPVKDQGQCGSCYSFATSGTLEGQWYLKKGQLISLSEQQIVDCSTGYGNQGCNGGLMTNSYKYLIAAGGEEGEADYPYTASSGTCKFDRSLVKSNISGWVDIQKYNETALQSAVANVGPVAIGIDSSSLTFQFYSSGVYTNLLCSSTRLDHAVLAVGYGRENLRDYWLVKNSWGTSWGEQGYIKMSRNLFNQCGVATMASYPIVG